MPAEVDKLAVYADLTTRLEAFLADDHHGSREDLDDIALMSTVATLLKQFFAPLTFAGFYRAVPEGKLVVGPYQGDVLACTVIPFGRGVCGTAAARRKTIIVPDVSQFPGYLACDAVTQAEIVVPVFRAGRLVGVLDLDSAELGAFDDTDRACLEALVNACFV
ncbi:MAG: hypothetical protein COZ06_14010 [Armatimonadetes bacterium CG_4_10_14_3_um_filter_66_18]|nr:GAF domain-containing protein [Armatimonadota bacterium]OIO94222.1 MAG: hypothetical protein AUJ96_28990 [Armatimonadetes bacterium CG2_30_66_41]PIX45847.1 MAG: hypothetical protein COZ57_14190 [Armatimonadetes bacterium CG_4_8_14_3_um_filter_66_20]PIY49505.1 MAG: hypothetical protein COZ06_14010 [Armatimonadetes bacterium CG_4_10_14_3_um_filter_66_18]PIZ50479.1 MAG: hypothetical protein COY42_01445 [Armatimonadetes bacterium CG_4_10_14_0_8_um_filter_66_14]PJB73259.1 MAG: hypothetical prote